LGPAVCPDDGRCDRSWISGLSTRRWKSESSGWAFRETQAAGYEFETWFFDLVDYFEVTNRRPYKVKGRQIDGSVTVEGTTYLVELKFTASQAGATDVDVFRSKVLSKADNTMGVMVSISGYSGVAVTEASREQTPLLLLDHAHIYMLLTGVMRFNELVDRVRRHSSQTGDSYLRSGDFGL
jgi:hypothetical protein